MNQKSMQALRRHPSVRHSLHPEVLHPIVKLARLEDIPPLVSTGMFPERLIKERGHTLKLSYNILWGWGGGVLQ